MRQKVFLITPYDRDSDFQSKKEIVEKCCLKFGFELILADPFGNTQTLDSEETILEFKKLNFFIADLSYERPSCYFEVGYIQSTKKFIRLIAKHRTPIHLVENRSGVQFYKDLDEYEKLIISIITEYKLLA